MVHLEMTKTNGFVVFHDIDETLTAIVGIGHGYFIATRQNTNAGRDIFGFLDAKDLGSLFLGKEYRTIEFWRKEKSNRFLLRTRDNKSALTLQVNISMRPLLRSAWQRQSIEIHLPKNILIDFVNRHDAVVIGIRLTIQTRHEVMGEETSLQFSYFISELAL